MKTNRENEMTKAEYMQLFAEEEAKFLAGNYPPKDDHEYWEWFNEFHRSCTAMFEAAAWAIAKKEDEIFMGRDHG